MFGDFQQIAALRLDQSIDRLDMTFRRRGVIGPELGTPEGAQGCGVPGHIDRLRPQPRPQHRLSCPR
jgi:hypothetical protein